MENGNVMWRMKMCGCGERRCIYVENGNVWTWRMKCVDVEDENVWLWRMKSVDVENEKVWMWRKEKA